jgi:hypothetical protein
MRDSSELKNGGTVAPPKAKRKRRRPPRKVLRKLTPGDLMQEAEFRRWRYHAPASLKRQAYELVKQLAGKKGEPAQRWTERV